MIRALASLAALCLALLPGVAHGARRYAVVIGNDQGGDHDAPLRYAEEDARRVAEVLTDLGGVLPQDLVVLLGADADAVRSAIAAVARRVDGVPDAVIVVYYSGHADTQGLHLDGTRLGMRELSDAVDAVPADVRVLMVDACRSGELTRLKGGAAAEPFSLDIDAALHTEGLAILASSGAGEDAVESERLRGGVFTHHLLGALQGAADTSGDGLVTLTEVHDYVYRRTVDSTSAAPFVQHPSFSYDLRGHEDLVLSELATATQAGWMRLRDGGEYLLFERGRHGSLVAEVDVPDGARLAVPPGSYVVRRREGGRAWEAEVDVNEGEESPVDAMAPLASGAVVRRGLSEHSAALAFTVGGGVAGAPLPGLGLTPGGALGLRIDTRALTLLPVVRYGQTASTNADLTLTHRQLAVELGAVRMIDVGGAGVGLGVRAGVDGAHQGFDTLGVAPDRLALGAHTGSMLRFELAPGPRWLVGLELGADASLWRVDSGVSPTLSPQVVPRVALDLARY